MSLKCSWLCGHDLMQLHGSLYSWHKLWHFFKPFLILLRYPVEVNGRLPLNQEVINLLRGLQIFSSLHCCIGKTLRSCAIRCAFPTCFFTEVPSHTLETQEKRYSAREVKVLFVHVLRHRPITYNVEGGRWHFHILSWHVTQSVSSITCVYHTGVDGCLFPAATKVKWLDLTIKFATIIFLEINMNTQFISKHSIVHF